jgi:hypothetical protein
LSMPISLSGISLFSHVLTPWCRENGGCQPKSRKRSLEDEDDDYRSSSDEESNESNESSEEEEDLFVGESDDEDYEEGESSRSKSSKGDASSDTLFYGGPLRSFACEKHSKWKKKCPANCPLRKELARLPHVRRKLWTKRESALLVQWAGDEGPLAQTSSRDVDAMWEEIARTLDRSVNSTKKKFMRYVWRNC